MKTATIDYKNAPTGELYIDGKPYGKLAHDAVASDSGTTYQAFVHDHPEEEELGSLMIVWETNEAWEEANEKYKEELEAATDESGQFTEQPEMGILDDESNACDWDKFTVYDESGVEFAKTE